LSAHTLAPSGKNANRGNAARFAKWAPPGLLLITIVGLGIAQLRLYPYALDDAYIHFRIAQNLAEYHVPYFNPTEAVKASSSSGWTILLFIPSWIAQQLGIALDLPRVVACLNTLWTVCGAWVYARLLRRVVRRPGSAAVYGAFGALYISLLVIPSIGLMETPLALLVTGIALHGLLDGRAYALSLLGVAMYLRPELVVLAGVAGLYALARRRISLLHSLIFGGLGVAPFLIYDLYFFGTFIPNTVQAKSLVYDLSLQNVVTTVAKGLLPNYTFLTVVGIGDTGAIAYFVALLAIVSAVFIYRYVRWPVGTVAQAPDSREAQEITGVILLWGLLVAGAYTAAQAFVFPWYMPLYTVPLAFVCVKVLLDSPTLSRQLPLLVLMSVLLIDHGFNLIQLALATTTAPVYYQDFGAGARVRHYLQIGKELFEQYPDARLLTSEIGGLGYSFRGYIWDGAGLVSPAALRYHPMKVPEERSHGSIGAIPVKFIEDTRPDIIVSYDTFIEDFVRSAIRDSYTQTQYPLYLPDDMSYDPQVRLWGSQYLNVFIRKDLPEQ